MFWYLITHINQFFFLFSIVIVVNSLKVNIKMFMQRFFYLPQLNGSSLLESRRIRVDTIWNMTSLCITRAERGDAGDYSLSLENQHGVSTFKVKIIVLGEWKIYISQLLYWKGDYSPHSCKPYNITSRYFLQLCLVFYFRGQNEKKNWVILSSLHNYNHKIPISTIQLKTNLS